MYREIEQVVPPPFPRFELQPLIFRTLKKFIIYLYNLLKFHPKRISNCPLAPNKNPTKFREINNGNHAQMLNYMIFGAANLQIELDKTPKISF